MLHKQSKLTVMTRPSSTCFIFADTAECNYYAREITTATIFANDIPLEAIGMPLTSAATLMLTVRE